MLRAALHALRHRTAPCGLHARGVRSGEPAAPAAAPAAAPDAEAPLSRDLLRCRTPRDFIQYALRHGAVIKRRQKGTHATVQAPNGVSLTLVNCGQKDLQDSACKLNVAVFDRMGIARDVRLRRGGEQWRGIGVAALRAAPGPQP
jgi:hypothetical protein